MSELIILSSINSVCSVSSTQIKICMQENYFIICTKNKLPKGLKKGQVQQVIFEGGGDDLVKTTHITCA